MARPRRQVYTMQQYLDNVKEGYISNNVSTQRNPKWKPLIDGLSVTISNDEYIPPIILAEDETGRKVIVDGGSRTTAFIMLEKGNHKIKSSVEDPIIKYKSMRKDDNGKTIWEDATFDIRNKTFEQFPKELKKQFYEYQVETVIHECTMEEAEKYLRRYNEHTVMNANEKLFLQLPKFANEIREIIDKPFFINCINSDSITETQKEKGILERIVSESVMCMYHFDKWNKNGKKLARYLNSNSVKEEFDCFGENINRLEKIVTEETKVLFNSKDTFIWLTFFEKFKKLGIEDDKFSDFLNVFVAGLRDKPIDGKLFDKADEHGSTKDKKVIETKLHILETLMLEFLHIDKEDTEEVDYIEFVKDNVEDIIDEDIDTIQGTANEISEELDESSWMLSNQNYPAYFAIVGLAFRMEEEAKLKTWLPMYEKNNQFIRNQKEAFLHMKQLFIEYIQKGQVA